MLTPEQKEARIGLVTSSIVAAILGLDPYKGEKEAIESIMGRSLHNPSKATERGDLLEDVVLRSIGTKLGIPKKHVVQQPGFVKHPNGWSGDSVDAIISPKKGVVTAVCEAKTVGMGGAKRWGPDGTKSIPDHVLCQCHWHMIHWPTAERCHVAALIGGYAFEFRHYVIEKDPELEKKMLSKIEAWYKINIEIPKPCKKENT